MSASTALADAKVLVLGMRSVEGDDELANALTDQLRGAARQVEGWEVSQTAVSMAQMGLAHGCDEIDAACLADISKGLQVDRIIFGTIRRTSARADHAFAVMLSLFDAQTGEIARQIDDTIAPGQTDAQALAGHAQRLLERVRSVSTGGAISIQANVVDAEVTINGQPVGQTRDGALRLEGLEPGLYRVQIAKSGYTTHMSTVAVGEGADTSLAAVLSQEGAAAPAASNAYVDDSFDAHDRKRGSDLTW
ncbi:MAG TPA: PEGA domain-containing protein, partial [Polyangiales bacterium]|nr:PEGA domain-containing protein [Polyangiales bacterium]